VVMDKLLYRPAEVDLLVGNPEKAGAKLGWHHSIEFEELVREMVVNDCAVLGAEIDTARPSAAAASY
jgi:GDPmannose 4,6-dehydratase